jgi:hypothetical protein
VAAAIGWVFGCGRQQGGVATLFGISISGRTSLTPWRFQGGARVLLGDSGADLAYSPLPATPEQHEVPEFAGSTTRACEAPSAQLRAELDKVMDATRTMFSAIDRFIMLGQYHDAISVLDARIKNEPDARASWISLMAIYRDAGMKDDSYRAYANF